MFYLCFTSLKNRTLTKNKKPLKASAIKGFSVLRGHDSNMRPLGYEPNELPTAPPRGLGMQIYTLFLAFQLFVAANISLTPFNQCFDESEKLTFSLLKSLFVRQSSVLVKG